jgi:hypothetical protein
LEKLVAQASLASNPAKASASGRRRTSLAADEVDVTLKARSDHV